MKAFKIIGSGLLYIILAGISCWATEQSLHLLLPAGWPEILVWGITIAFFVMASLGTALVVSSLNSYGFIENRNLKLWGGVVLVVLFWLLMSMPTNTHTFFYNDKIGSVISKDIETTNNYLSQIIDKGTSSTPVFDTKGKETKDYVEDRWTHIVAQFKGEEAPFKAGNGPRIGDYLKDINDTLNSSITQDVKKYYSKDPTILNQYRTEINKALFDALKTHTISEQSVQSARKQRKRLSDLNDSIQNHVTTGRLSDGEIKQCEKELKDGYNIVSINKLFVDFDKDSDDEIVYTKENVETRTKRMASVIDVFFVDFLSGKYPASFWYYVLLSILVDIAAFIFFDILFNAVFKNNNYN